MIRCMLRQGGWGLVLGTTGQQAKLVPGWPAPWGSGGYAIGLVGLVSAFTGPDLRDWYSLPGGLWEVFMGVWRIAKCGN